MSTETFTPKTNINQHVQDLRQSAGNVAHDLKDEASVRLNEARDQANAKFQDAKERANTHLTTARSAANDLYSSTRDFVKEHPFTAIGAGILIGAALVRSRRK